MLPLRCSKSAKQCELKVEKVDIVTWGRERMTLVVHATVSMILLFRLASLIPSGFKMADCLSRLMTTVTKAHEYMATSFMNISSLQARSPACHCTVMFHAASTGITMKVTSRSATVRFMIKILTWDLRLPPFPAAHSTSKLQTADTAHRVKVMITRTLAAVEKVGSCSASPSALLLQSVEAPRQLPFTVWSVRWWNIMKFPRRARARERRTKTRGDTYTPSLSSISNCENRKRSTVNFTSLSPKHVPVCLYVIRADKCLLFLSSFQQQLCRKHRSATCATPKVHY